MWCTFAKAKVFLILSWHRALSIHSLATLTHILDGHLSPISRPHRRHCQHQPPPPANTTEAAPPRGGVLHWRTEISLPLRRPRSRRRHHLPASSRLRRHRRRAGKQWVVAHRVPFAGAKDCQQGAEQWRDGEPDVREERHLHSRHRAELRGARVQAAEHGVRPAGAGGPAGQQRRQGQLRHQVPPPQVHLHVLRLRQAHLRRLRRPAPPAARPRHPPLRQLRAPPEGLRHQGRHPDRLLLCRHQDHPPGGHGKDGLVFLLVY
uniref:Uncharacterized protein n=1 Tax=Oryza rufipogon TaxID=4529 RepID=A0A0E0Q355_ORYRU